MLKLLLLILLVDATPAKKARKAHKRRPAATATAPAQPSSAPKMAFDEEDLTSEEEGELEDGYVEPTDDTSKTTHYVPKDGRQALVVALGYEMLMRQTSPTARDGVPPQYSGAISPGLALSASVYPARFTDGPASELRNLGGFARVALVWMRSIVADTTPATVHLDVYYSIHTGAVYRHLFGTDDAGVGLGAELGLAWDGMTADRTSPFPSTMYVSPLVNVLLEVPFAGRHFVWQTRAGIMPISWLGSAQTAFFGKQSHSWGLNARSGFHSTIWRDYLYAEADFIIGHYWQQYGAAGSAGLSQVQLKDLTLGFSAAVGVTY